MKFPGSKLLHNWDLSAQHLSLNDLLRSCQQIGLTGFAEVKTPTAIAMIFYYLGAEVNALYREGSMAYNGTLALERLRAQAAGTSGEVAVYELPLDMAHLLRGITNRQKMKETLKSKADLAEFLDRMETAEHTGTLEAQTARGAAMVLLVNGRVSNIYWETRAGQTFEKGEARNRLEETLDDQEATLFLSEFSRDVWKSRHEIQASVRSKLEGEEQGSEALGSEEVSLRQKVLDELTAELPAVVLVFMFDLLTGAVYARKAGKSASALRVGLLAEKAQPTELIGAALSRVVRSYAARLSPARGTVAR